MVAKVEDISVEEMVERAEEDAGIGRFIAEALAQHCEGEDHAMQFLTSLIINMSANHMICPVCFQSMLEDAIEGVFEKVDNTDGTHDVQMRNASQISEIIKKGETSH